MIFNCLFPGHTHYVFHNYLLSYSMFLYAFNGESVDPVSLFEVTHTFKNVVDPTCESIKEKMKAMKEQVENGELDMSLEDTYRINIPSTSTSARKMSRHGDNSTSYFSKMEEQLAVMQHNLDEANFARANQAKEIERLKRRLKKKETKMMQYLNQCMISLGKSPLPEDALDIKEEESVRKVEEEREGSSDEEGDEGCV